MAGSPLQRARKQGIRLDDGSVVAFPCMLRVAELPRGWHRWSPAAKIEHLLGMSLDQAHHILAWPTAELDPPRLAAQGQVRHVIMTIGTKAALDREAARERGRERLVKELAPRFIELWAGAADPAAVKLTVRGNFGPAAGGGTQELRWPRILHAIFEILAASMRYGWCGGWFRGLCGPLAAELQTAEPVALLDV